MPFLKSMCMHFLEILSKIGHFGRWFLDIPLTQDFYTHLILFDRVCRVRLEAPYWFVGQNKSTYISPLTITFTCFGGFWCCKTPIRTKHKRVLQILSKGSRETTTQNFDENCFSKIILFWNDLFIFQAWKSRMFWILKRFQSRVLNKIDSVRKLQSLSNVCICCIYDRICFKFTLKALNKFRNWPDRSGKIW